MFTSSTCILAQICLSLALSPNTETDARKRSLEVLSKLHFPVSDNVIGLLRLSHDNKLYDATMDVMINCVQPATFYRAVQSVSLTDLRLSFVLDYHVHILSDASNPFEFDDGVRPFLYRVICSTSLEAGRAIDSVDVGRAVELLASRRGRDTPPEDMLLFQFFSWCGRMDVRVATVCALASKRSNSLSCSLCILDCLAKTDDYTEQRELLGAVDFLGVFSRPCMRRIDFVRLLTSKHVLLIQTAIALLVKYRMFPIDLLSLMVQLRLHTDDGIQGLANQWLSCFFIQQFTSLFP
jgi:hypothetical protein